MKKSIIIRILLTIDFALAIAIVTCSITKIFFLDKFSPDTLLIVMLSSFGIAICLISLILLYLNHKAMISQKNEVENLS